MILNQQRRRGEVLKVEAGDTDRGVVENLGEALDMEVEGRSGEGEGEAGRDAGTEIHRFPDSGSLYGRYGNHRCP